MCGKVETNVNSNTVCDQESSTIKVLFNLVIMKTETFDIGGRVFKYPFIEGYSLLKISVAMEAQSSHKSLQLSEKVPDSFVHSFDG